MKRYTQIRQVVWRLKDSEDCPPEIVQRFQNSNGQIKHPGDVHRLFRFLFDDMPHERFIVVGLNSANRVQGFDVVSEGILNSSLAHPREVFRYAVSSLCASIIIMHNHPSGNPEPSSEDIAITKQINESGKILGIKLQDHIIFAGDVYTSFADRGMI